MPATFLPETYTSGELAEHFGVRYWRLVAALKRHHVSERGKIGIFRWWHAEDLPAVRAALIACGYIKAEVAADAR